MELASYFQLELDTTSPVLEIFSPNNASASTRTRVRIQANEELSNYQDVYAIDNLGNRQDLTFVYHKDYFETDVIFKFDNQLVTIFAQLKDTVGNLSDVVTKSIRILNGKPMNLITNEVSRKIVDEVLFSDFLLDESDRISNENIQINDHQTSDSSRNIVTGRNPYYERTRGQP